MTSSDPSQHSQRPAKTNRPPFKEAYKPTYDTKLKLEAIKQDYRRDKARAEARRRVEREQARIDDAKRKKIRQAAREKRVTPSMTAEQATKIRGKPSHINRSDYGNGVKEHWVYRDPQGNSKYVYVKDGKVTATRY